MKKKVLLTLALTILTLLAFGVLTASAAKYGDLTYEISGGKATITDCDTYVTSVTIPSEIEGYPVIAIGSNAFYDCYSLASITIPDSVTSIGDWAFGGCDSLKSITIPNSVTFIGEYAFYHCTSLTSITIPDSVTSISCGAFDDCTSLESITLPDGVTTIEPSAFEDCTNLGSITLPNSVTYIGCYAFLNCKNLESITIPNGVTFIDEFMFANCTNLGSITLSNSITSIEDSAFRSCTSLTSITIPDSVTYIGSGAFGGCDSLKSITIPNSVTFIGSCVFEGCDNLTISCEKDSYAQSYAIDNNIPYIIVETGGDLGTGEETFSSIKGSVPVVQKNYETTNADGITIKSKHSIIMYGLITVGSDVTYKDSGYYVTKLDESGKQEGGTLKLSAKSVVGDAFAIRIIGEAVTEGSYKVKPYLITSDDKEYTDSEKIVSINKPVIFRGYTADFEGGMPLSSYEINSFEK